MIDIRPIKEPESFFYGGGWFVLGFVLLALSLLGAWLRLRRRPAAVVPEAQPGLSPQQAARRRLEEAWAVLNDPASFTVRVSAILREYLEASLNLPAPERTTEEFLLEVQSCPRLKYEQQLKLAGFLQSCDLVKFAREELPVSELRALHQAALQLIEETQVSLPLVSDSPAERTARSS